MKYDHDFWSAIDTLVSSGKIVIDRPKGSTHPRFPHIRYDVDYGYKRNRHDRNHACSTKFEFYCLTSREHMPSAFSVQSAKTYRKEGKPLFPGAWEKRRLLCSASREKKGACVNSHHTRSQIEDNHQRATGRVDVPRPKTTSAIRIEQQRLFCSCRTAGQTAPKGERIFKYKCD